MKASTEIIKLLDQRMSLLSDEQREWDKKHTIQIKTSFGIIKFLTRPFINNEAVVILKHD